MSSNTPAFSQRCVCWYTVCHGGGSLGIVRHCMPVRTMWRKPWIEICDACVPDEGSMTSFQPSRASAAQARAGDVGPSCTTQPSRHRLSLW